MRNRPNERLLRLVEAAFGERPDSDLGALSARESERLVQLRALAYGLSSEWHTAPASLVEAAKAVFEGRSIEAMRVASSNLHMAGARAAGSEAVHVAYESGEDRVRTMYLREPDGWRVMGEAPGPGWRVLSEDDAVEVGADGRFDFFVRGDALPTLLFIGDGRRLLVTPPDDSR